MKYLKFYIIISLVGSLFFSSCADWLDEEHETLLTVDAIYTTPEGLSNASVGLYYLNRQILRGGGNNDSEMFAGLVRGTDIEISRNGTTGAPAYGYYFPQEINTYRYHQRYWDMYYSIIGKANEIIFYGEQMNSNEFLAQRAIAEAKYFRALSFLTLYERFENIFLSTTPITPDNIGDERVYEPATKNEIFSLITKDLDDAIVVLPLTPLDEPGRITKGAARHVRMLSALWQEDWDEAIEQGEAIAASGQYELLPLNQVFANIDYSNHKEAIAVWHYFEGLGGADYAGQWGYSGHRLKALFIPEYHRRNGNQRTASNGGHGRAWSFPNPYLISLYDQENDQRYNAFYRHNYVYTSESAAADAGLSVGDVIPARGVAGDDFQMLHIGLRKFEDVTSYSVDDSKGFADVMQFRYAQTCIHLAEAYLRDGNMPKALEWFNKTWERAGNVKLEADLTIEDIMDEHARELGMEGHRWAFLKRIGKMESQIKLYAGEEGYNVTARTNFQPHNVRWPIPQNQLNIFGDSYPQNDGYPR